MTGFSVVKNVLIINCWRLLNFSLFGGLRLNLLYFLIVVLIGAKLISFVRALVDFLLLFLYRFCNF